MTVYEIDGQSAERLEQLADLEKRLQDCEAVEVVARYGSEEKRVESTLNACDP